jgi:hypothetical protein
MSENNIVTKCKSYPSCSEMPCVKIAEKIQDQLKALGWHQCSDVEPAHHLARFLFMKKRAVICLTFDCSVNEVAVNAFWDVGSSHEAFEGVTVESTEKAVEAVIGKATLLEELNRF